MVTALVAALALPVSAWTGGPFIPARPYRTPRLHLTLQAPATASVPPIPSSGDPKLLALANEFTHTASGFYSPPKPELIADDFVFRGPEVGPLTKEDYLIVMDTFKIYRAFPDIKPNPWGFTADPENPRCIWFFVRNTGTHTGPLGLGYGIELPPSNKAVQGPPEAFSMTFDDEDRVRHLTVGYVTDRFQGNTGGKGAALGLMRGIGFLPSSVSPGVLETMKKLLDFVPSGAAKTASKPEDVPSWWTHSERNGDGMY